MSLAVTQKSREVKEEEKRSRDKAVCIWKSSAMCTGKNNSRNSFNDFVYRKIIRD